MDENRPTDSEPEAKPEAESPAVPPADKPQGPPRISIRKFFEAELRVGKILSAERIPNADRLLKLQVDLGAEQRQLVAGISQAYEIDRLTGRRIIVVANLEPARIRGVESQGMLLAADLDGRPVLAGFDEDVPPGTPVR